MRKPTLVLLVCASLLFAFCPAVYNTSAQELPVEPQAVQLQSFLTGLSNPLLLTNARDGRNRVFVVEQTGRIKVVQPGSTTPTVFLDISARIIFGGERGLLGLAFHPDYETNRRFFVNYTRAGDGATVIAEYRASASDPNVADTAETPLLTIAQPFANHNGGMIEFGPDGFLYIGMGDGGSGNDPDNHAQNINDLLGKFLRIDIDHPNGAVPYSSPSDNPFFGGTPGLDEIYAVGVRNPFRWSFDRVTGQLIAGDVGQGTWEEIDIITKGGNFGWRIMEGNHCNPNFNGGVCTAPSGHIPPIAEYVHAGGRCSITGGYKYRGGLGTFPWGAYIYADYCTGEILKLENGVQSLVLDTTLNITSFGEDEGGEIYVLGQSGTASRLVNPPQPCAPALSSLGRSFSVAGGEGAVGVTSNCNWTALSNVPWIIVVAGTDSSGKDVAVYEVRENFSNNSRVGTLIIAGQIYTVTQAGRQCTFSLGASSQSFGSGGGTGGFSVTTQAGCNWSANSNDNWITILSGGSGAGSGSVSYSVAQNTGPLRTGTISVAGLTFTVKQKGGS